MDATLISKLYPLCYFTYYAQSHLGLIIVIKKMCIITTLTNYVYDEKIKMRNDLLHK